MGYLLKVLINQRSIIIKCFLSLVVACSLQQYSQAQTIVDVENKQEIDSQVNLLSENPKQNLTGQKKAEKNLQNSTQEENEEPLDFTSLGRSGEQTAGEHRGSCPLVNVPLTVIAPKSNVSLTTKSHPQFWFYLPYDQSKISRLEFSIVDKLDNDVTRFDLSVPQDNSYISAALPESEPGLVVDNPYKWHLKVYCNIGKRTVPTYVSGALVRVVTNPSQAKSLGSSHKSIQELIDQNLWIDAVHLLFGKNYSGEDAKMTIWNSILGSSEINLQLPDPHNTNIHINQMN